MSTSRIVINGREFSKTVQEGISASHWVRNYRTYGIDGRWVEYEEFIIQMRREIEKSDMLGLVSSSVSDIWIRK